MMPSKTSVRSVTSTSSRRAPTRSEASLTTIREDLAEIRELAPDTAPDEADAFDNALASLDDAITALGDEPLTAESAQDLVAAGTSTIEAGQAYLGALDEACP